MNNWPGYGYADSRPRNWRGEVVPPECTKCPPPAKERAMDAEDLDALPVGTVVEDRDGDRIVRHPSGWRYAGVPQGVALTSEQLEYRYGPHKVITEAKR